MNRDVDYRQLLKSASAELESLQAKLAEAQRARTERIAVIGMGCRFPGGADSPDRFWHLLENGVDAVAEIPPDRWNLEAYYDPDVEHAGTTYSRHAALLQLADVESFDPQFFRIGPREAAGMDPQHRKLLEVCWEALEHAAVPADRLAGTPTGLFVGSCTDDYLQLVSNPDRPEQIEAYTSLGTARSILAGRVAHVLGLEGPAIHLDTACSTSLMAVHLACQSLRAGECDLALAGAVNLQLSPLWTIGLCRLKALSPTGRCRAFDADADGFVRGEGCGIVVLQRLSDAQRAGNRILAIVAGEAVNHDGRSGGLTVPNQRAQQKLIEKALRSAGIEARQVDYVEAHGTGTPLGDPIEMDALRAVFSSDRSPENPLIVGAVKSNVGHLEAAAGMAGLLKVILAMEKGWIPPNLHFENPNPRIRWNDFPVRIPTEPTRWPNDQRKIAGISAFGFSGTNVHLILESPLPSSGADSQPQRPARPLHVLPLSATTEPELAALARRYEVHLATHDDQPFEDVCFTAGAGRTHFAHRLPIVADSPQAAREELGRFIAGVPPTNLVRPCVGQELPHVAFLFSGQGTQHLGMGRELYWTQPTFRGALEECDELLRPHLGESLLGLFAGTETDERKLEQASYAQPALFALEYALARLWQSWGVQPTATLGHSLGEFAAACLAGVFSLADSLKIIVRRGQLTQRLDETGMMAAVEAPPERLAAVLASVAGEVSLASLNGPRQTVISGRRDAMESLLADFRRQGIRTTRLPVSHAFHSPLVEPMLPEFARVLADVDYAVPQLAVISNVTGSVAGELMCNPAYWLRHLREPVQFAASMQTLAEQGCRVLLEIGPHPTLALLAEPCLPNEHLLCVSSLRRHQSDWSELLRSLSMLYAHGVDINWRGFDRDYPRRVVSLPTYPFQRQRCWADQASRSGPSESYELGAWENGSNQRHQNLLLGRRLESAGREVTFETPLGRTGVEMFADHRINGTAVLPMTAVLEMALAAAESIDARHIRSVRLAQVTFERALSFQENEPRRVQFVLSPRDAGWEFALHARDARADAGAAWVRHAVGQLYACDSTHSDVSLTDVQQVCDQPVSIDHVYEQFRQAEIEHGPSFRTLKRLWQGTGEALAEVQLPEQWLPQLSQYRIHPALLEGALQAVAALLPAAEGRRYLPVSIDELRVFGIASTTAWSHVRLQSGAAGGTTVADLRLFSADGATIAELTGLRLRYAERDALARRSLQPMNDWLYTVDWSEQSPPEIELGTFDDAGTWLLFADEGCIAQELTTRLHSAGQQCVVVFPEQADAGTADGHRICPTSPDDFDRLLDQLPQHRLADGAPPSQRPAVRGVIHLWSLRGHAVDDQRLTCGSAICLIQALARRQLVPRVFLVTRGGQPVGNGDAGTDVSQSPLWGLGRVIALEQPELQCRCIDLDPGADDAAAARQLVNEIGVLSKESQVAYRGDEYHVARLVRHPPLRDGRAYVSDSAADVASRKLDFTGTCLVTGGLGALGGRVAEWLVEQGARSVALVGRRGIERPDQSALVERLSALGAAVKVLAADISQRGDVVRVLEEIAASMPPLRTVIHTAGVLDDGVLLKQDWQRFERVLAAKVYGAWHLHELTMGLELDRFVLFSSVASLLGNVGQGNYAAANAFLDTLAHRRHASGLPALSIGWGPWRARRMAVSLEDRNRRRPTDRGLSDLPNQAALDVMGALLEENEAHVAVMDVDWERYSATVGRLPLWSRVASSAGPEATDRFLKQLKALPISDRAQLLRAHVRQQVAVVLGLADAKSVPADRGFFDLGMDSLTSLELRNRLRVSLSCELSATLAFDYPTVDSLTVFLADKLFERVDRGLGPQVVSDAQPFEQRDRTASEPLAIVGMSCRMPGGCDNPQSYWRLIASGGEAICEVPPDRWDVEEFYDPNPDTPARMYTRFGGFLSHVADFDAHFFGIMPREARCLDPQQRLLLEVAYEALEDAAISSADLDGSRTGVFIGISGWDFPMLSSSDYANINAYTGTGTSHSAAAGRISYTFGCKGPAVAVDTACSSSLVSLHLACQSLRSGESDQALVGGVNVALAPDIFIGFSKARMLSPEGRCRTFDAAANGYVRGEGVGMIVLKRLADAQAAGDRILAVIRGTATNHSGRSSGLTVPSGPAQAEVIQEALDDAGLKPDDIGYLEAHGTGTPLGDPIELQAIGSVFRGRREPLLVGSVKTNVGHLEMAAGFAGLIKVVLALQHEAIPPHLNFENPNPEVDWDNLPVRIPCELQPWRIGASPRRAGVSAFGFSGTNAHVVIEEAPATQPEPITATPQPDRPLHIVPISARAESAIPEIAARYEALLSSHPQVPLADVAYTAGVGRSHWEYRQAVVAASSEEAQTILAARQHRQEMPGLFSGKVSEPHLAVLFTGQGSQYPGMGQTLYRTQPTFRRALDRCDAMLLPHLQCSLLSLLFAEPEVSQLDQTGYTQPAMFALQYALYELWKSWGILPQVAAGHSVGEYMAAYASGVFSLADALKLISARGRLMQSLPAGGGMVAVMTDEDSVRRKLAGYEPEVSIAAINAPGQTVISGSLAALDRIVAELDDNGIRLKRLTVSHAFHSSLMEPMLDQFYAIAQQVEYSPPERPFISNLCGEVAGDEVARPEYWCKHIRQPVEFVRTAATLFARGCNAYLEIGPQPTLVGLCRQSNDSPDILWLSSLQRDMPEWQTMLNSLAQLYVHGAKVDWKGFDADYPRQRVRLPTYPFQRQRYWPADVRNGRSQSSSNGAKLHPLLGHRLDVAGDRTIFENELAPDSPAYLTDHALFGTPLFPAAAFLETALAGGKELFAERDVVLRNVSLTRALALPQGSRTVLQVLFEPREQGQSFRFCSRDRFPEDSRQGSSWSEHASGEVLLVDSSPAPTVDLAAIQQRCWVALDVAEIYEQFRRTGLEYGAAFQGIKQLWRGENEALGWLEMPPATTFGSKSYRIHPVLLDAALQVLAAAIPEFTDQTYLPVGVDQLRQWAELGSCVFGHARLRQAESDQQPLIVADIGLIDSSGRVVVSLEGLRLKEVLKAAFDDDGLADPKDSLYQVAWRDGPLTTNVAAPPGTWLILAFDHEPLGQHLADHLEQLGHRCVMVRPGSTAAMQESDSHCVDPANPHDFRRLLDEVSSHSLLPLRGILYLWSLAPDVGAGDRKGATGDHGGNGQAAAFDPLDRQRQFCGGALHLVQSLPPDTAATLWLVTRGAQSVTGTEVVDPHQSSLWGLGRVIALEKPELKCTCIDLDPSNDDGAAERLMKELSAADGEVQVGYRQGQRFVSRLVKIAGSGNRLQAPDHPYRLKLPTYGSLDDFQLAPVGRQRPGHNELEIEVEAAGLNFRDVLRALGMLQAIEIPLGIESAAEAPFGFECAGTVLSVGPGVQEFSPGDKVIAIGGGTMRSHMMANVLQVVHRPDNLDAIQASSIPLAFLTAYMALEKIAQLRPGEKVLIHAAAGGVGQAAVQLAKRCGAEVFATASPGKWDFLRTQGLQHVMNSRTCDFADEIIERTDGRGVDVVLNSLNGDFIPAGLRSLAKGGRFVEIGKIGVWSSERMAEARPDVQYFVFDLGEMEIASLGLNKRLLQELMPRFVAGEIAPLPISAFPIEKVSAAFRELSQARHRGKVVLSLSKVPSAEPVLRVRPDASYLITGGLGGLGREVARWLVDRGARHLLLVGRQGADSPEKQAALNALTATGADVRMVVGDVSNRADVDRALSEARRMGPLRGVVHAAGLLRDGMLDQLRWESFEEVMRPKIAGGWHLHALTEPDELEFFVCFSSIASLIGSPGQANYAAANAFLDGLAHARRAARLPATTINWGPWAGAGMAARLDERDQQRMTEAGWRMLAVDEGLQLMAHIVVGESAQVGVLPVDWRRFTASMGELSPMLKEIAVDIQQDATSDFLATYHAAAPDDRRDLLFRFVRKHLAGVLAWESADSLDPRARLFDLGMDSLTAVELQNRLQRGVGFMLPRTLAFDYPTMEALVGYIHDRLSLQAVNEPSNQSTVEANAEVASDQGVPLRSSDHASADNRSALDDLSESELEEKLLQMSDSEIEELLRARLTDVDRGA